MNNHARGLWVETLAALFLRCKGYRILARRWRAPAGEIDIVAARGRTLVFVEVKQRASRDAAAEAVTRHNQDRVRRAAALYLQKYPAYNGHDIRFDVLAFARSGWPRHETNAF